MAQPIVDDELIWRGRVVEVHRVSLRVGDGEIVARDLVRLPGAAVIVPVCEDGRIVMIRNWRFAVGEHLLELPAGTIDSDEEPAVCAARELTEETGFSAGSIEPLGWFYTAPGVTTERMNAFVARKLTAGEQRLEGYEQIDVVEMTESEVRSAVLDGTIHDGKTISAMNLYWMQKGAGTRGNP